MSTRNKLKKKGKHPRERYRS